MGLGARAPNCAVRESEKVKAFDCELTNRAGTGTQRLWRTTLCGFDGTAPSANGGVELSSRRDGGSDSANGLTGGGHFLSVTGTIVFAVGREALDNTSIGSITEEACGDTSIGADGGTGSGTDSGTGYGTDSGTGGGTDSGTDGGTDTGPGSGTDDETGGGRERNG